METNDLIAKSFVTKKQEKDNAKQLEKLKFVKEKEEKKQRAIDEKNNRKEEKRLLQESLKLGENILIRKFFFLRKLNFESIKEAIIYIIATCFMLSSVYFCIISGIANDCNDLHHVECSHDFTPLQGKINNFLWILSWSLLFGYLIISFLSLKMRCIFASRLIKKTNDAQEVVNFLNYLEKEDSKIYFYIKRILKK